MLANREDEATVIGLKQTRIRWVLGLRLAYHLSDRGGGGSRSCSRIRLPS